VLCVRRNSSVVMAADGQVTLGESVIKAFGAQDSPALPRQDSGRICRLDGGCILTF